MNTENTRTIAAVLRHMCLALLVMGYASLATAQEQGPARHGLMWHRTGLPAVFPLQVKTHPGQNYYLLLNDAENGGAALAAFIEGGRFFRVLVPPGTFRVRFAIGKVWQGEDKLFGPGDQTEVFELADPLTFAVRNYSTKGGHVVDLTVLPEPDGRRAEVRDTALCQRLALAPDQRAFSGAAPLPAPRPRRGDPLYRPDPLTRLAETGVDLAEPEELDEAQRNGDRLVVRQVPC